MTHSSTGSAPTDGRAQKAPRVIEWAHSTTREHPSPRSPTGQHLQHTHARLTDGRWPMARGNMWRLRRGSNPRPTVLETAALPTELRNRVPLRRHDRWCTPITATHTPDPPNGQGPIGAAPPTGADVTTAGVTTGDGALTGDAGTNPAEDPSATTVVVRGIRIANASNAATNAAAATA